MLLLNKISPPDSSVLLSMLSSTLFQKCMGGTLLLWAKMYEYHKT